MRVSELCPLISLQSETLLHEKKFVLLSTVSEFPAVEINMIYLSVFITTAWHS